MACFAAHEDPRGARGRDASCAESILEAYGNTGELAQLLSARAALIDCARLLERKVARDGEKSTELGVGGLDGRDTRLGDFFGRDLASLDRGGNFRNRSPEPR